MRVNSTNLQVRSERMVRRSGNSPSGTVNTAHGPTTVPQPPPGYTLPGSLRSQWLVMLLLLFITTAFGQTATIGTGTSTQNYPMGSGTVNNKSTALYSATEIGFTGNIAKLAWYSSGTGTVSKSIKIYLQLSTDNSTVNIQNQDFGSSGSSGFTLVYSGTISLVSGWNTITLDTPFLYTGGTNKLMVGVETTGSATASSMRYTTNSTLFSANSYDNGSSAGSTATQNRPNIQITKQVCDTPTAVTTSVTASSASAITGTITPAATTPTGYVVFRSTSNNPIIVSNNSTYAVGSSTLFNEVVYNGTSPAFTDTGLSANTAYYYKAYAYNNENCAGPVYSAASAVVTATTCAAAPAIAGASNITPTAARLNWSPVTGGTGTQTYNVDVSATATFGAIVASYTGLTAIYKDLTGLTTGTTYYYRVNAIVGTNCTTDYATGSFVAQNGYSPISVTGFNADVIANGAGLASASTTVDAGANGYVYMAKDYMPNTSTSYTYGLPASRALASPTVTGLNYILANYTGSNSLRLPAVNNTGTLTFTQPVALSTVYLAAAYAASSTVASVSANILFSDGTTQLVNISLIDWAVAGTTEQPAIVSIPGYADRASSTGAALTDATVKIFQVTIPVASANLGKLISGITFTKTAPSATSSVPNIFAVSGTVIPETCVTPAAAAISVTPSSSTAITGTITAPVTGATGYVVFRSTVAGLNGVPLVNTSYVTGGLAFLSSGIETVAYNGTALTFNSTGLTANTKYYYRVFAYNSGTDCTGPVYSAAATTVNATTCTVAPVVAGVTNSTATTARLNWNTYEGTSIIYTVDVATDAAFTATVSSYTGLTTIYKDLTDLIAGTTYYYRVKALGTGGCGDYATGSFTAQNGLTPLSVTGFNTDAIANGAGLASASTTADVDGNGTVYLSKDYMPNTSTSYTYGLPVNRALTSPDVTGLNFILANYTGSNSLRIATQNATGTLTLTQPSRLSTIYLIAVSGGTTTGATISATILFSDGTSQLVSGIGLTEWTGTATTAQPAILSSLGNVSRTSSTALASSTSYNNKMYQVTIPVATANLGKLVSGITIIKTAPASTETVANVFAVSGNVIAESCATPAAVAFSATASSSTTVTTTITAPAIAPTGYIVVRSLYNIYLGSPANNTAYPVGGSVVLGTVVYNGSALSFTDTGLAANTTYYYTTYAYNSGTDCTGPVYSATSPTVTIKTCVAAPVLSGVSNVGSNTARVNWATYTSASVITYTVDVATDAAFTAIVGTYTGTNIYYDLTGLTANATYYYRVKAVPAGDCGDYATSSFVAKNDYTPLSVTGFTADVIANGTGLASASTTAAVDTTTWAFLSRDYNNSAYTYGLPVSRALTSPNVTGLNYIMADYSGNNALRIQAQSGTGTLTLVKPFVLSNLYLAIRSTGASSPATVTTEVLFSDGTSQTTTTALVDGASTALPAIVSNIGRTNRTASSDTTEADNQRINQLSIDILAANQAKTVTGVKVTKTSPASTTSVVTVYAISGKVLSSLCVAPAVPAAVVATATSTTAINIAVTAAATAPDGYLIIRSTEPTLGAQPVNGTVYTTGSTWWTGGLILSAGPSATVSDTTLYANTPFYYFVYAYNNTDCTGIAYSPVVIATATTCMTAPNEGIPTNITTTSATVNWGTVTSGSSTITYTLEVYTNAAFTASVGTYADLTTATKNLTGLTAGTTYYYRVKTAVNGGCGDYRTGSFATTSVCVAPLAPAALTATVSATTSTSDTVTVTPAATTPSGYLYIYSTSSTLSAAPVNGTTYTAGNNIGGGVVIASASATSVNMTLLVPGTTYYYFVYAYNSTNCTGRAYSTTAATASVSIACAAAPVVPAALTVTAPTATSNTITVTPAATAPTGYLYIYSASSSTLSASPVNGTTYTAGTNIGGGTVTIPTAGASTTITSLLPGTTYNYFVYAYNSGTNCSVVYSPTAATGSFTTECAGAPTVPAGVIVTPTTSAVIYVGATPAATAAAAPNGYLYIRSTSATLTAAPVNGTTYAAGTTLGGGTVLAANTANSTANGGLNPNTTYYYFVYAYNSTANCSKVYSTTAATAAATTCAAGPGVFGISNLTATSFTATWTAVTSGSSAITYSFDLSTNSGFTNIVASYTGLTTTSQSITGLTPGTLYYGRLKYSVNGGCGMYTAGMFTTQQYCVAPAVPAALTATASTATSAAVTITPAATAPYGYLYIRSTSPTLTAAPVDGTTYATGATLGGGTVVVSSPSAALNNTSLTANTTYYYFVYAYNATTCTGRVYSTTPATATVTTCTAAPAITAVTNLAATSATVNWTEVTSGSSAVTYTVEVYTNAAFTASAGTYTGITTAFKNLTGLTLGTTYYYRVKTSVNGGCGTYASSSFTTLSCTGQWTGAVSTNWATPGNWCNSILPTATTDVTIPSVTNMPVVFSGTIALSNNLTVSTGATLTVNTGGVLNVTNTLATTGTVTVQNNASLLQGSTVTANTNTGNVTVIKNSNPLYRLDYTMWSSPVAGTQSLLNFSPLTNATRFYEYKYDVDPTSNVLTEQYFDVAPASTFTTAKGYLIRMPNIDAATGYNTGTAAITYTGNFTGTPNNGTVTIPASVIGNKYTAIGNPYPSPISVVDFYTENAGVIENGSAIYFWRKRNNAAVSSYAYITLAGLTANGASGTVGYAAGGQDQAGFYLAGQSANYLISQGQGFIVKTKANPTTTNITFKNSMRRAVPGTNPGFFKSAGSPISRLWLNMTNSINGFSQAAVAYIDGATLDLDYGYDGKKFTDGGSVAIYSLAADTNLAIQARPEFEATDVVPMGYVATTAGQHSIALDHFDGVFEGDQNIYIKDNMEGLTHNLKNGAYTFITDAGTFDNRFEVVYTTTALDTDNTVLNANNVIVYQQDGAININSSTAQITGVTVYDIHGRKLYSKDGINAMQTAITGLNAAHEMLIVEVTTVKGKVSKKIIF